MHGEDGVRKSRHDASRENDRLFGHSDDKKRDRNVMKHLQATAVVVWKTVTKGD